MDSSAFKLLTNHPVYKIINPLAVLAKTKTDIEIIQPLKTGCSNAEKSGRKLSKSIN